MLLVCSEEVFNLQIALAATWQWPKKEENVLRMLSLDSSRFFPFSCGKWYHRSTKEPIFRGRVKGIQYLLQHEGAVWGMCGLLGWEGDNRIARGVRSYKSGATPSRHAGALFPFFLREGHFVWGSKIVCIVNILYYLSSVVFCPWAKLKLTFLPARKKSRQL